MRSRPKTKYYIPFQCVLLYDLTCLWYINRNLITYIKYPKKTCAVIKIYYRANGLLFGGGLGEPLWGDQKRSPYSSF
ncbi:MAG: hypothetical protein A2007_05100 [Verrucomicrobia bacterium GWC2_42_7]|nr:MAG: hypothetical protein A2007_05100 [Verrucomicrobia bacterium GWC2_42_7]